MGMCFGSGLIEPARVDLAEADCGDEASCFAGVGLALDAGAPPAGGAPWAKAVDSKTAPNMLRPIDRMRAGKVLGSQKDPSRSGAWVAFDCNNQKIKSRVHLPNPQQ